VNREPRVRRSLQRLMHAYWRFSRGMTLGVRAAVLDGDRRVFLVRHTYVAGWHLPGGGVEPGETAVDALRRELEEEARLELTGEARFHGIYLNLAASARDHVLLYVAREFRPLAAGPRNVEIAEAGFFPLDALPTGTTRSTRARLEEIASGRPPAATW
jgi:8-oxo-dGTP pyrophosphatase MutT (NUDIX family)